MVLGLVSRLSLANHPDSRFLPGGACLVQPRWMREGFWEVVGHVVSPFDLSRTLAVVGDLIVLCSLPGVHCVCKTVFVFILFLDYTYK